LIEWYWSHIPAPSAGRERPSPRAPLCLSERQSDEARRTARLDAKQRGHSAFLTKRCEIAAEVLGFRDRLAADVENDVARFQVMLRRRPLGSMATTTMPFSPGPATSLAGASRSPRSCSLAGAALRLLAASTGAGRSSGIVASFRARSFGSPLRRMLTVTEVPGAIAPTFGQFTRIVDCCPIDRRDDVAGAEIGLVGRGGRVRFVD
jgi:hypothetical protein